MHANVWPEVLATLRRANIVGEWGGFHLTVPRLIADYSIHYFEPHNLLIAHMRYVGAPEDFEKDMAQIGEDEHTRKWWKVSWASTPCDSNQPWMSDATELISDDRWDAGELRAGRNGLRERAGMVDYYRGGLPFGRIGERWAQLRAFSTHAYLKGFSRALPHLYSHRLRVIVASAQQAIRSRG